MLSESQVREIMPGLAAARSAAFFPFLQAAMTEFAIDRPAREAAFLAQIAHESGQFKFMEEIWGPTDSQRRYEPMSSLATDLGNTEAGDGKRFKGRGPIQITGRSNYRRFGDLLHVDIVADPPRAALPELGFRIAGLYWSKKGLNELADLVTEDAFKEITRRINGGFRGLKDRQAFYDTACRVLGVAAAAATRGRGGDIGEDVAEFTRGAEAIRTAARRRPQSRKTSTRKASSRKRTSRKAASSKAASRKAPRAARRVKRTSPATKRRSRGSARGRKAR